MTSSKLVTTLYYSRAGDGGDVSSHAVMSLRWSRSVAIHVDYFSFPDTCPCPVNQKPIVISLYAHRPWYRAFRHPLLHTTTIRFSDIYDFLDPTMSDERKVDELCRRNRLFHNCTLAREQGVSVVDKRQQFSRAKLTVWIRMSNFGLVKLQFSTHCISRYNDGFAWNTTHCN